MIKATEFANPVRGATDGAWRSFRIQCSLFHTKLSTKNSEYPKKGAIAAGQSIILERIGGDGETFITFATRFLKEFGSAVGAPSALIALCTRRQIRYLRGIRTARRMFGRLEPQLAA